MSQPFWVSAFLDFAPDEHDEGLALWERLTGYSRSASRGPHDEFVTLQPPGADDYLRVQRLAEGPTRIHLDMHVTDPRETPAAPPPGPWWSRPAEDEWGAPAVETPQPAYGTAASAQAGPTPPPPVDPWSRPSTQAVFPSGAQAWGYPTDTLGGVVPPPPRKDSTAAMAVARLWAWWAPWSGRKRSAYSAAVPRTETTWPPSATSRARTP